MSTRHIVYMGLSDLKPAVRNPKDHDLPGIVASLRRYGWNSPAEVDERTGRMVVGHGRREACITMRENGENPPGGVFIDDDGEWLVPVLRGAFESHTDAEAEAYIIAHNYLSTAGGWYERGLAEMLEDVVTSDAPLIETTGMTFEAVDSLLAKFDPETLNTEDAMNLAGAGRGELAGDDEESVTAEKPKSDEPDLSVSLSTRHATCPECHHEFEV